MKHLKNLLAGVVALLIIGAVLVVGVLAVFWFTNQETSDKWRYASGAVILLTIAYFIGRDINKPPKETVDEEEYLEDDIGCHCTEEEKHGETSIICCNHCGLPTEEFWTRKIQNEEE